MSRPSHPSLSLPIPSTQHLELWLGPMGNQENGARFRCPSWDGGGEDGWGLHGSLSATGDQLAGSPSSGDSPPLPSPTSLSCIQLPPLWLSGGCCIWLMNRAEAYREGRVSRCVDLHRWRVFDLMNQRFGVQTVSFILCSALY